MGFVLVKIANGDLTYRNINMCHINSWMLSLAHQSHQKCQSKKKEIVFCTFIFTLIALMNIRESMSMTSGRSVVMSELLLPINTTIKLGLARALLFFLYREISWNEKELDNKWLQDRTQPYEEATQARASGIISFMKTSDILRVFFFKPHEISWNFQETVTW